MIEHLPLAISSLNAAKEVASALVGIRDFDKISSATIELKSHILKTYDHILSEKERISALQAKIDELEKECSRLKDWSTEKEQYSLREVGSGNFAYVRKDFTGNLAQAQKLCCNCYDKTIKSTLQQRPMPVRTLALVCPNKCPELFFSHYISYAEASVLRTLS